MVPSLIRMTPFSITIRPCIYQNESHSSDLLNFHPDHSLEAGHIPSFLHGLKEGVPANAAAPSEQRHTASRKHNRFGKQSSYRRADE